MYCKEYGEQTSSSNKSCSGYGSSTFWGSGHSDSSPYPPRQAETDPTCMGSAIAGAIALLSPLFGVAGIIAIVCGAKGRLSADETVAGSRDLATLGMVLGFLPLLRLILGFLTLASMMR